MTVGDVELGDGQLVDQRRRRGTVVEPPHGLLEALRPGEVQDRLGLLRFRDNAGELRPGAVQQHHERGRGMGPGVVPDQRVDADLVHGLMPTHPALGDGRHGHVADHPGVRRVAATLAIDVQRDRRVVVRRGVDGDPVEVDARLVLRVRHGGHGASGRCLPDDACGEGADGGHGVAPASSSSTTTETPSTCGIARRASSSSVEASPPRR